MSSTSIKKIGPYEVYSIETGTFALDGGAMFGIVPKTIWSKTNPSDELNRIEMHLRCLLLVQRNDNGAVEKAILIDNGIGTKWTEKFMKIYKIDFSQWSLDRELKRCGVQLEQVTDVIATHLHFDHMGGTTRRIQHANGKQELIPTFPNAKIWVQEENWNLAYHPNEKDRASYLRENFDFYENSSQLQKLYTNYGEKESVFPHVFVQKSNGHTPGMQLVEISDDQTSILYCADAIPTASHVRVPYIMGYDCFPLKMIEEKKKILSEAAERGTALFFEHCPYMEAARVMHDGKDFAIKQKFNFS